MTHPRPAPTTTTTSTLWQTCARVFASQGPGSVVNLVTHEHDQSIELYFEAGTPADWLPTADQLQAVCAVGFATVYAIFPDDTELIGSWRTRLEHGVRVPGGEYWTMAPRREPVGLPRYAAGVADRTITLHGGDVELFKEFLVWKAARP
jgi:hypothetical protein